MKIFPKNTFPKHWPPFLCGCAGAIIVIVIEGLLCAVIGGIQSALHQPEELPSITRIIFPIVVGIGFQVAKRQREKENSQY